MDVLEMIIYCVVVWFASGMLNTVLQIWKARILLKIQKARNQRINLTNYRKAEYKMISQNRNFEDKVSIGLN